MVDEATAVDVPYAPPAAFGIALLGARPNPVRGAATIAGVAPGSRDGKPVPVRMELFTVAGRRVRTLLAGALVPAAYAVTLVWQNDGGGQAGVAANWNPAQVPAEADLLRFDLAGAYTVTFGAAADSVTVHQFAAGDVTLAFSVSSTRGET